MAKQSKRFQAAVKKVREALGGEDRGKLDRAVEELERASHQVAQEIYSQATGPSDSAGPGQGPAHPPPSQGPRQEKKAEGEVIDADYKVVDDGKK